LPFLPFQVSPASIRREPRLSDQNPFAGRPPWPRASRSQPAQQRPSLLKQVLSPNLPLPPPSTWAAVVCCTRPISRWYHSGERPPCSSLRSHIARAEGQVQGGGAAASRPPLLLGGRKEGRAGVGVGRVARPCGRASPSQDRRGVRGGRDLKRVKRFQIASFRSTDRRGGSHPRAAPSGKGRRSLPSIGDPGPRRTSLSPGSHCARRRDQVQEGEHVRSLARGRGEPYESAWRASPPRPTNTLSASTTRCARSRPWDSASSRFGA
jgi:hypothetical protein